MTATKMICILRKKGYRHIEGTTFIKKGTVVTVKGSSMEIIRDGITSEYPFEGMKCGISGDPFYEGNMTLEYIGL